MPEEPRDSLDAGEAAAYAELAHKVLREFGFDFSQYKPNYLRRRIAVRMRAMGAVGYADYSARLDRAEFERLHDRITINVTEFFRDPEVYGFLETSVLPPLCQERLRQGVGDLRAWSAGCSSGEEPYSLALILSEAAGPLALDARVTGTDIDPVVLDHARVGIYEARALKPLPGPLAQRLFRPRPDGRFEVLEPLRRRVLFRRHHLMAEPPLMGMDLILCRNVMIYFSKDQHQPLFESFHRALNPGGCLVIGKTESMMGHARELFSCLSARERVYRRLEA